MTRCELMLMRPSFCLQPPTHLFGSVSSDVGFRKNSLSDAVSSPLAVGQLQSI